MPQLGVQQDLLNYSAPFRKVPQFITLFADYERPLRINTPWLWQRSARNSIWGDLPKKLAIPAPDRHL